MARLQRLTSTEGYVAVDLDYRVYARGADPTRLLIVRCAQCGFCEYVTDFSKALSAQAAQAVTAVAYRELLRSDRASDFPLVAFVKEAKQEPAERVGYCYLRASWFSGDLGREEEEQQLLAAAVAQFEKARESTAISSSERNRTVYLLAELYRRMGRFGQALDNLARVSGEDFQGLVRDQRNLIELGVRARRRIKAG